MKIWRGLVASTIAQADGTARWAPLRRSELLRPIGAGVLFLLAFVASIGVVLFFDPPTWAVSLIGGVAVCALVQWFVQAVRGDRP